MTEYYISVISVVKMMAHGGKLYMLLEYHGYIQLLLNLILGNGTGCFTNSLAANSVMILT